MKLRRLSAFLALAVALAMAAPSCNKPELPQPKPVVTTDDDPSDDGPTDLATEPAACTNKVVAHRGGSSESGNPDNSRASLKYTMSLKCYAMECDIYWTKDNNVVIAHAANTYFINNLKPWEHTLLELRKAGKLKNGEELPTLEEFLDIVQVEGNCTKLCLDIKNLDGNLTAYPIKAVQRACEIIKSRKAEKFCEFICTSNETVAAAAANCMVVYGIPVGWMANKTPAGHKAKGFSWANLSAASYMTPYGEGVRTVDEFKNAGMAISVFNIDKKAGDGNAVYSDEAVNYYVSRYNDLRFICTNYPSWLLNKLNN
ncbi:MAG: glycerophosphodiester phosphodiesterase [Bacteroidales bacterium]|nr:glycerophosphodiester phosphodiesterase [Bacteroidales bacterium]